MGSPIICHCPSMHLVLVVRLYVRHLDVASPGRTDNLVFGPLHDSERSDDKVHKQLCVLMQTAYCFEYRHPERLLQPWVSLWSRLSMGRITNYHDAPKAVACVSPCAVIFPMTIHVSSQICGLSQGIRMHLFLDRKLW